MFDSKSLLIARREYLALVRSKAFLVGLILAPALVALTTLLAPGREDAIEAGPRQVALLDETGRLETRIAAGSRAAGLELVTARVDGEDGQRALERRVRAGELAALLRIGAHALDVPSSEGRASSTDREIVLVVQNLAGAAAASVGEVVRDAVGLERMRAAGIPEDRARQLLGGVDVTLRTPESQGEPSMRALLENLLTPLFTLMLVFMAVMSSAPYSLHSVIEEKQQRIAEVLLGCMSPFQLMAGKLLGTAGAGLTVVVTYAGLAYFTAGRYGLDGVLSPTVLFLSVADATIAILSFGAIFLAMGAASSELKDAQGFMGPLTVVMMLPLMFVAHLIRSPDGPLAVGLSLFPLTAPLILPLRLSLGSMPSWQVAVSVGGTIAFTVVAIWAASRVFRIGILAQGRAPRLREIARWIRQG